MPTFRFEAVDKRGQAVSGVDSARNISELADRLRRAELTIIDIQEEQGGLGDVLRKLGFTRRLPLYPLVVTLRQFTTLIGAGIPITSALDTLSWQGLDRRVDTAMQAVLKAIESGKSLSRAFEEQGEQFPPLIVPLLKAGETAGKLDEMLDRLTLHLERELELVRSWRQATAYPFIIFLFCSLVTLLLVTHVFPVFIGMFKGLELDLPVATRALITITETVRNPVVVTPLVVGLVLSLYLLAQHFRTPVGRRQWDWIMLELPYLGVLSRKVAFSRVARTLGVLLASGISTLPALRIAGLAAGNTVVRDALERVAAEMKGGAKFSERLEQTELFPDLFVQLVMAGEESGALPEQLQRIGALLEEEVHVALASFTSLVEPVMILVMGAVVMFVLVAVFQPVYQLMTLF